MRSGAAVGEFHVQSVDAVLRLAEAAGDPAALEAAVDHPGLAGRGENIGHLFLQ